MQKFVREKAVAAPLPLTNVDTDMIIPAQYMKALTRSGLGKHLFQELRFARDGSERSDFILNRPACRAARILIADRNFGCGSSREHAVWALTDFGIRCIVAPSFGDIFAGNARKNGLLLIRLPDDLCTRLRDEIALTHRLALGMVRAHMGHIRLVVRCADDPAHRRGDAGPES